MTEMPERLTVAINWAAACGGCDVSILDLEGAVLDLAALVEFVYWPVAMDFKREDLRALAPGSVEIGLFNGAVRTKEQEEDALLMRERCQLLVAYGTCACFGGIPGLANVSDVEGILQTVYADTASTDNPDGVRPQTSMQVPTGAGEVELELPELCDRVRPLHQVVDVDLFMPGCPPPTARIQDLVAAVAAVADGQAPPPRGTFLASGRGLEHAGQSTHRVLARRTARHPGVHRHHLAEMTHRLAEGREVQGSRIHVVLGYRADVIAGAIVQSALTKRQVDIKY
jgi:F420-non-reducing hydrogenase small subunit